MLDYMEVARQAPTGAGDARKGATTMTSVQKRRELAASLGVPYKKLVKMSADELLDAAIHKMRRDGDIVFDAEGVWLRDPDEGEYRLLPREPFAN